MAGSSQFVDIRWIKRLVNFIPSLRNRPILSHAEKQGEINETTSAESLQRRSIHTDSPSYSFNLLNFSLPLPVSIFRLRECCSFLIFPLPSLCIQQPPPTPYPHTRLIPPLSIINDWMISPPRHLSPRDVLSQSFFSPLLRGGGCEQQQGVDWLARVSFAK